MKTKHLRLPVLLCIVVISGCADADAERDRQFASQLDAIRPLVENDKFSDALVRLLELVHTDDALNGKIEQFRTQMATITAPLGSRAYRSLLQEQEIPTLSKDEMRAVYLMSVLALRLLKGDWGCNTIELLYLGALNGYPLSQYQIGGVLGRGFDRRRDCGWPQDLQESVYWYAEAAEQGHSDGQVNYAVAMLFGKGTKKAPAMAIDLLTQNAKDRNNPKAQYLLGLFTAEGYAVEKSVSEAIGWLRKAALQAYGPAQYQLGMMLWEHERKYDEARQWLLQAAESGMAEAQYQLGAKYTIGVDGEFWRPLEAVKWFSAAARKGHLKAQTALGLQYWYGDQRTKTISPDYKQAVTWLSKAAERGDSLAQTYIGYAYSQGYGVPRNPKAAIEWWRKAANQNDSRAEEALGLAYENGRGVPQNLRLARDWYQRAKRHGSMGASDKLKASRFEALEQQDKGIAMLLGLLVLGAATSDGQGSADSYASQGCSTTFGTFQEVCDSATDIGWAGMQMGIW